MDHKKFRDNLPKNTRLKSFFSRVSFETCSRVTKSPNEPRIINRNRYNLAFPKRDSTQVERATVPRENESWSLLRRVVHSYFSTKATLPAVTIILFRSRRPSPPTSDRVDILSGDTRHTYTSPSPAADFFTICAVGGFVMRACSMTLRSVQYVSLERPSMFTRVT